MVILRNRSLYFSSHYPPMRPVSSFTAGSSSSLTCPEFVPFPSRRHRKQQKQPAMTVPSESPEVTRDSIYNFYWGYRCYYSLPNGATITTIPIHHVAPLGLAKATIDFYSHLAILPIILPLSCPPLLHESKLSFYK